MCRPPTRPRIRPGLAATVHHSPRLGSGGLPVKICPNDNLEFSDAVKFCPQCGNALRDLDPDVDKIVGGSYKLLNRIGEGWAGYVCRATHVMMGKDVALKVISRDTELPAAQIDSFREWARVTTNLTHDHIALIHDLWLADRRTVYIATELIKGKSVRQLLAEEGPVPGDFFLKIIRQVCEALRFAHEQDVRHGDLKPANVMLTNGDDGAVIAKVLDFRIGELLQIIAGDDTEQAARFAHAHKGRLIFGDCAYTPPELLEGEPKTPRSDIYSLGVMMYEMLAGARPFRANTPEEHFEAHLAETPLPLTEFKPQLNVPRFIERAVLKALEKSPRRRQQSVDQLLEELDAEITESEAAHRAGGTKFWERVRWLLSPGETDRIEEAEPETALRGPAGAREDEGSLVDGKSIAMLTRAQGGEEPDRWEVTSLPLRIGRSSSNDIVIKDASVSRHHARILLQNGRLLILDENSANGTFVNQKRTRLKKLHDGDEVQLGDVQLRFELTSAEEESGPDGEESSSDVPE